MLHLRVLQQVVLVCFDARLRSSCTCAHYLSAMFGYLGDGLLSVVLHSRYSTCVSCDKWFRLVSMLGRVASVLVRPLFLYVLGYLGGGLVSDAFHSRSVTCVACDKKSRLCSSDATLPSSCLCAHYLPTMHGNIGGGF